MARGKPKSKRVRPRSKTSPKGRSGSKRTRKTAAEEFVDSLRAHGQLHEGTGPLPGGATHVVKKKRTRSGSKLRVERKRFSYV